MRIALAGSGRVAAVHASRLGQAGVRIASVCGSILEKAQAFADTHGIERAAADLDSVLDGVDAIIIASPSGLHYPQARRALERGLHVLLELPPCDSLHHVRELERLAAESKRVLQCCHTSRYLAPYRRIREWIHHGVLGEIRQVHYLRCIVPLRRSWTDNALLHHASHPIDLFLDWFGDLEPLASVALPAESPYTDVNLLTRLPNGAPASVAISYSARKPFAQLILVGSRHTVTTDGFSSMDSDEPAFAWHGEPTTVYEQAIADQDASFLESCRTGDGGVPWSETARLMRYMETFQELCNP